MDLVVSACLSLSCVWPVALSIPIWFFVLFCLSALQNYVQMVFRSGCFWFWVRPRHAVYHVYALLWAGPLDVPRAFCFRILFLSFCVGPWALARPQTRSRAGWFLSPMNIIVIKDAIGFETVCFSMCLNSTWGQFAFHHVFHSFNTCFASSKHGLHRGPNVFKLEFVCGSDGLPTSSEGNRVFAWL